MATACSINSFPIVFATGWRSLAILCDVYALLNPESLFPCLEGDGVLLIDTIDHQLDQNMAQVILNV